MLGVVLRGPLLCVVLVMMMVMKHASGSRNSYNSIAQHLVCTTDFFLNHQNVEWSAYSSATMILVFVESRHILH